MEADQENTLKILLATDNHLGFMERDPIRGNDSFVTFDEILRLANEHEADFILLGGDLFHENRPSRKTLYSTMELLRNYCTGDRPCAVEFLSDPKSVFKNTNFPVANYMSPNYNISMPVFTIHGNHDDPTGFGARSAMDVLSVSGLVNYFGHVADISKIDVFPVLLQKGRTKLALYGIGHVRDERLHHAFVKGHVKLQRPEENPEDWFNIFVLHQNRRKHGLTNYIPEDFLADFLDLVIWGHEHDCLIDPTPHETRRFYLSQPGSSVATSLAEGEAGRKHVALVEIKDREFRFTKLPLESVRLFVFETIKLKDSCLNPTNEDRVEAYIAEKMKEILEKAQDDLKEKKSAPRLPLVRLKVDNSGGYSQINSVRFGQKWVGRVANPKSLLQFFSQRQSYGVGARRRINADDDSGDEIDLGVEEEREREAAITVTDLIEIPDKSKMVLLSEYLMKEAVGLYVNKSVTESFSELVSHSLTSTKDFFRDKDVTDSTIVEEISQRRTQLQEGEEEQLAALASRHQATSARRRDSSSDDDMDTSEEEMRSRSQRARGRRARAGGAGSRGGRRAAGRGARETAEREPRGRSRGRPRGRAAGRSSRQRGGSARAPVVIEDEPDHISDSGEDESMAVVSSSRSLSTRQSSGGTQSQIPAARSSRKRRVVYVDDDDEGEDTSAPSKRSRASRDF